MGWVWLGLSNHELGGLGWVCVCLGWVGLQYLDPPSSLTCTLKLRRIYVRPRTGPQSAQLWWPAVAKLQAASVPIAQAAAPRDGRIAVSLNSLPNRAGHNNSNLNHQWLESELVSLIVQFGFSD